jgi:hypothetical protein
MVAARTIARARALATDPQQQLALAASQVRLLLKDGHFGAARRLADSVLASIPRADVRQAEYLAGLAALTGKLGRTAHLLQALEREAPAPSPALAVAPPRAVAHAAAALTAHAALGACSDSLLVLERQIEALIERHVEADSRPQVRDAALARALGLAVPCARDVAARVPDGGGRLARMQRAYAAGLTASVLAHFDTLRRARRTDRPGDVTLDHLYQEAWLLAQIGDTAGAVRHLDAPLTALPTLDTGILLDAAQAAAVGRVLALRVELAAAGGDHAAARRWAAALEELWRTADPPLQRMVQHAQSLVR